MIPKRDTADRRPLRLAQPPADPPALRMATDLLRQSQRLVDEACNLLATVRTPAQPQPAAPDRPAGQPWPLAAAAEELGVHPTTLARAIVAGKLKSITLGRRRFIPDAEVRRVAEEGL